MRSVLTNCLALGICVGIPSQTVHLVGPGGLPQIRDAIAIATPGDIVLVQPGNYAHFIAQVGITIRAETPGTVDVAYDPALLPPGCSLLCLLTEGISTLAPPVGQELHVVGLNFVGNTATSGNFTIQHRVQVSTGRVTLDTCQISAREEDALFVANATLHLQDSTVSCNGFTFGRAGLFAVNSDITATGCTFTGGSTQGIGVGAQPGPGIRLVGSRLHASGIDASGGNSAVGSLGGPGLRSEGASTSWLSDATLSAGPNSCAIENVGSQLRLDRCTLIDNSTSCPTSPLGGALLGVERVQPLSPGSLFELRFRTDPNGFVVVFAAPQLGTVDFFPLLEQPSWLDDSQSFSAALVLADATGLATASWTIPGGPAITDQRLWFKGISGFSFPLQASPVTGGVAR